MSAPALRSQPEPGEDAAPDWLEAARQAFLWRYFYDDCGRSDQGTSGLVRRGPAVEFPPGDARMSDAASHEVSRRAERRRLAPAPLPPAPLAAANHGVYRKNCSAFYAAPQRPQPDVQCRASGGEDRPAPPVSIFIAYQL